MDEPDAAVGRRLAELRQQKGLRQEDFLVLLEARGVRWTQTVLSRVEGGKRALKATELFVVADALDIEAGELNPVRDTIFRRLQSLRLKYYEACTNAGRAQAAASRAKERLTALTLGREIQEGNYDFTVRGTPDRFRELIFESLTGASGLISADAARELFGHENVDRAVASKPAMASSPPKMSLQEFDSEMRMVYADVFTDWLPRSVVFVPDPQDALAFSVEEIEVEDNRARMPYWLVDFARSIPNPIDFMDSGDRDGG